MVKKSVTLMRLSFFTERERKSLIIYTVKKNSSSKFAKARNRKIVNAPKIIARTVREIIWPARRVVFAREYLVLHKAKLAL